MSVFEKQLCERYGWYIVENRATIRQTAKAMGLRGKSTVHREVTKTLPMVNSMLAAEVRKVLDQNKAERSLRGGDATKRKYELAKLRAAMDKQQQTNRRIAESLKLKSDS